MADKPIMRLGGNPRGNEIMLQAGDEPPVILRRVKSICVEAVASGPAVTTLAVYGLDHDSCLVEVDIPPDQAQAILRVDARRQLSFLTDGDSGALRGLLQRLTDAGDKGCNWYDALAKIIAELDRRETPA
jgi:hypothetical protein